MKTFPDSLFNAELVQTGRGDHCETYAEKEQIEFVLERGSLVLYPNGHWIWKEEVK